MRLPGPKALLFDWDNTLVDTWEIIHRALNVTLEAMGHAPWTIAEVRQRVRASARDSFPKLFGARAAEAMDLFYRTFEGLHLDHLRVRAGAEEMLEELKGEGLLLSVVSNKKGALLRREAEHLGWSKYFWRLVGAQDAARDKPAREAVELALSGSGLVPEPAIWFVGDTDIDMHCAVDAGCTPILLRPEPPGDGEFGNYTPKAHVGSCAELTAIIRQD